MYVYPRHAPVDIHIVEHIYIYTHTTNERQCLVYLYVIFGLPQPLLSPSLGAGT